MSNSLGHLINVFVVLNALLFLAVVYGQDKGVVDYLDKSFINDGFCISNKDLSVYYQSHALCFYADTAFCVILWLMTNYGRGNMSDMAVEPVSGAIMGIFGHGCGHLYLGLKEYSSMDAVPWDRPGGLQAKLMVFFGLLAFWFAFMRSMGKFGMLPKFGFALLYNSVHVFYVQTRFGFTYVQVVLMLHQALTQLIGEKGLYYTQVAMLISLPVGLAQWFEACTCSSFLVKIGGHLWFDLSIPLSMCVYFFVVRNMEKSKDGRGRRSSSEVSVGRSKTD